MTSSVVTIRDVASAAGVAVSTVSRVLNESGYASSEARERVLAAATRLGFRPSATARGLRRSRTMTLGVLVPDLANPVYLHYVRGAEHTAQRHGYALLICDGQASAEVQAGQLDRLYQHRVDGVLLAGAVLARESLRPFLDAAIPLAPPAVVRGRHEEPSRTRSENAASLTAFRHLASLGHRRVATVSRRGQGRTAPTVIRLEVLRAALAEVDATLDPILGFRADTAAHCHEAVRRLSALAEPPTAFIALNHMVAPLLLIALNDAGLRIPEDVSFLTYGDSDWALAHRPSLSVIRSNYYEEAVLGTERLIAQIERWPLPHPELEFHAEFVLRGSCAPPAVG